MAETNMNFLDFLAQGATGSSSQRGNPFNLNTLNPLNIFAPNESAGFLGFGGNEGILGFGDGQPGGIQSNLSNPEGFFQAGLGGTKGLGTLLGGAGQLGSVFLGRDQLANAEDVLDFQKAAFAINLGNELRTTQGAQDAEKNFLIQQYGPNHPLVTGRDFEAERVSAAPNLNFGQRQPQRLFG